jgi:hypothetical protein
MEFKLIEATPGSVAQLDADKLVERPDEHPQPETALKKSSPTGIDYCSGISTWICISAMALALACSRRASTSWSWCS